MVEFNQLEGNDIFIENNNGTRRSEELNRFSQALRKVPFLLRWNMGKLYFCKKCNLFKHITEMVKRKDCSTGVRLICKKCYSKDRKKYYHYEKKTNSIWRKVYSKTCSFCKKEFKPKTNVHINKYCSRFCYGKSQSIKQRKENNPFWKGGIFKNSGYVYIFNPEHPFARKKYIVQHRLVMEEYLGRYLEPEEIVHHINKNPSDNRIENLLLFQNNGEHIKHHNALRRKERLCKQ